MKNNRLISREKAAELISCTPQTISNWVKARILTPHYIGQRVYIDKDTLMQYIDTAQDVARTSERISKLRDELKATESELKQCTKERLHAIGLLKNDAGQVTTELLQAMLVHYQETLSAYEYSVLSEFIDLPKHGYSAEAISKKYGLTLNRIFQIAGKGIRRIRCASQVFRKNAELSEENQDLKDEAKALQAQIAFLQNKIEELQGEKEREVAACAKYGSIMNKKLVDFDLSIRALNVTKAHEIITIADLVRLNVSDLKKFKNCGHKTITELKMFLESHNLSFGMNI